MVQQMTKRITGLLPVENTGELPKVVFYDLDNSQLIIEKVWGWGIVERHWIYPDYDPNDKDDDAEEYNSDICPLIIDDGMLVAANYQTANDLDWGQVYFLGITFTDNKEKIMNQFRLAIDRIIKNNQNKS